MTPYEKWKNERLGSDRKPFKIPRVNFPEQSMDLRLSLIKFNHQKFNSFEKEYQEINSLLFHNKMKGKLFNECLGN